MNKTQIGIKLLTDTAKKPTRATPGSSGWDVYADLEQPINVGPGGFNKVKIIPTGIALEIPPGWEAQFRPRSGLAFKSHVQGHFGTVDQSFKGELKYLLWSIGGKDLYVRPGDRIGQLVFQRVPEVELVEIDELSESERGDGGFGSTGR